MGLLDKLFPKKNKEEKPMEETNKCKVCGVEIPEGEMYCENHKHMENKEMPMEENKTMEMPESSEEEKSMEEEPKQDMGM